MPYYRITMLVPTQEVVEALDMQGAHNHATKLVTAYQQANVDLPKPVVHGIEPEQEMEIVFEPDPNLEL